MTSCCNEYGTCTQGPNCPVRTGTVLPHQAAHAAHVAHIKSTRPAWLPGKGVPPEAGNFRIIDLGPDDSDDGQPAAPDAAMLPVRTLLEWLCGVVGAVVLASVAIGIGTEMFADVIWGVLERLS